MLEDGGLAEVDAVRDVFAQQQCACKVIYVACLACLIAGYTSWVYAIYKPLHSSSSTRSAPTRKIVLGVCYGTLEYCISIIQ